MKTKPAITAVISAIALALAIAGCSSASHNMRDINPIVIPDGLTQRETAAAVVNTIIQRKIIPASGKSPKSEWAGIVDGLLDARVWNYNSQYGEGSTRTTRTLQGWYVESISNDVVTLGFKNRDYYMSVRFQPESTMLVPKIVVSENLKQKGDSIHQSAIKWLSNISTQIRISLGYISVLKSQTLAEPVTVPRRE